MAFKKTFEYIDEKKDQQNYLKKKAIDVLKNLKLITINLKN